MENELQCHENLLNCYESIRILENTAFYSICIKYHSINSCNKYLKCIPSPPVPCTGQRAFAHLPTASPAPSASCLACGLFFVGQIAP
jgi:hypothetical protein